MRLRQTTRDRLVQRVEALAANFETYHRTFLDSEVFSGPSAHFHLRTLSRLRSHRSFDSLIEDDQYFELLYATLISWGLHRMGPGNAKLTDFNEFVASCRALLARIASLFGQSILTLTDNEAARVAGMVGQAIEQQTGITESHSPLVANSKAVHHFLPDLVPPVDRAYTLKFSFERSDPPGGVAETFELIFQGFAQIAKANAPYIRDAVARGMGASGPRAWDSSHAKVLDNVLIGWVRVHPRKAPSAALPESDVGLTRLERLGQGTVRHVLGSCGAY